VLASTCIHYHDCSPSLQTPPALHFIVCLRRTTGPVNHRVHKCADNAGSPQRNSKRTQPQSHPPAPLRTLLFLSSRQESSDRCRDLVRIRYRAATTRLHPPRVESVRTLAVCRPPEVWDKVKAGATLLNVMREMHTTDRRPTPDPIHVLPADISLPARSSVYILHILRTSYTSPCVSWLCTSSTDVQTFLLVPDAALGHLHVTMGLGLIHIGLTSQCYCAIYDFSSCHSWTPWRRSWCCILPPARRSPSFAKVA